MSPALPASLSARVERVRAVVARRVRVAALLWGVAGLSGVLVLTWLVAGPDGWSQGTPAPLLLDLLAVAVAAAAGAVAWRLPERWLVERRVTRAMEASAGLDAGSVEGALQLGRRLPPGVSGSLVAHGEGRVVARLVGPDDRLAGGLGAAAGRWLRRGAAGLALLAPAAALLLVASPGRATGAWSGLAAPLRLLSTPALPPLSVEPGDIRVLRGSALDVTVDAPGRSEVTLTWRSAGEVPARKTVAVEEGKARFRFDAVAADIVYQAAAPDGARSAEYRVTPVDPLLVSDVVLDLTFPPHTGRAPEEYRGDAPALSVPAGTRVGIQGRASQELTSAALVREADGATVPLQADGRSFAAHWTPREGGVYQWSFADADGAAAEFTPAPLDLTVVADSAPAIRFTYPGRDTLLPLDLRQPLVIEARDDYGLGAMELVAYRVTSLGERQAPVTQRMALAGTRAARARPVLDLGAWGLLPGDTVRYYARVQDNAPRPGEARTPEYVLRMPGLAEMRRTAQERMDTLADRLQALSRRADEAGEKVRNMERTAVGERDRAADRARQEGEGGRGSASDFQEQEAVKRALEEQQAMMARVDSARKELKAMADALQEAGASDPGLQADLQELQKLMAEAAPQDMRERLQAAAKGLDERGAPQAADALRQLTQEQDAFRKQLQASLDRLRRAAVDQDFRATGAEAEALARREDALSDALESGEQPELRASQQEALEGDAQALEGRLQELGERLGKLGEEDARQGVDQARGQTADARGAMDDARRAAAAAAPQSGAASPPSTEGASSPSSLEQASRRAGDAADALGQVAGELSQAQSQMSQQKAERARAALGQTAQDALALARRQGELGEQMKASAPDELADMRADQATLLQGLRAMAQNLETSAKDGMDPDALQKMADQAEQARQALQRTADALGDPRTGVPGPARAADAAVDALNRLALSAMEGSQGMAQSGQGQGQGQQPGQSVQQQLAQLAQQQGSLNGQAGQIAPLQLGQKALAEQMRKLAQGQGEVADNLDRVAKRPDAAGQTLGDLEALAREAAALAERLQGGRLDAQTRERQEKLFHRLLDAGRTLENDEVSDQRESTTATPIEGGEVTPLDLKALGGLPFGLPDAAALERLSPAERQLVLEYFERLNRASEQAPAAGNGSATGGGTGGATGGGGGGR